MSFTPRQLYRPGKNPQYPFSKRLGDPRVHVDFCRRDISLVPAGIRTPSHPARSLVAIPTALIPTHSVNLKCSIRFNVLVRSAVGPHQLTSLQLLRTESTNLYPRSLYYIAVFLNLCETAAR